MFLKENWSTLKQFDNKREYDHFPFIYSLGKYQSFNSAPENFITVVEFIRIRRPRCVVECGTFEARGTEYLARTMRLHCPHPSRLITIDVEGCIDHMGIDTVTFMSDAEYDESLKIRHLRLDLLKHDEFVEVIYYDGLTQRVLPEILTKYPVEFIYEDASHLPHILIEDWKHIDRYAKSNCIVCFDDMNGNVFPDWFKANVKGWDMYHTERERGQLWVEKNG